jgi:hypothetical protein
MLTEITQESSLDDLGQFVQSALKRSAADAWEIGQALTIAKNKTETSRKFGVWLRQWVPYFSDRTARRYMAIAELPREKVEGKNISKVYRLLRGDPQTTRKATAKAPAPIAPGVPQSASAGFEGAEPVSVSESSEKPEAFPSVRYTITATILLDPLADPTKIEDLLLTGQLHWVLKNGNGNGFGSVKVETVKSLDRIEERASNVAA